MKFWILIDRGNARTPRFQWRQGVESAATDDDLAGIWMQRARKDLQERRFACAIFSDEAMNFAATDHEVDAVERDGSAKALGDAKRRDCGFARNGGRSELH